MKSPKADIASRQDVSLLINEFYLKVRADELLSPVFSHVDWEFHTPVIIDFWCMVLLGEEGYRNNPFHKHIGLPIGKEHFRRWLELFGQTLDENFSGTKATEARERAHNIAGIFQLKLGLLEKSEH